MPVMNGNVATAEIRKIEYELKYDQSPKLLSPFSKSLSEREDYFSSPVTSPLTSPLFIKSNSTMSGFFFTL